MNEWVRPIAYIPSVCQMIEVLVCNSFFSCYAGTTVSGCGCIALMNEQVSSFDSIHPFCYAKWLFSSWFHILFCLSLLLLYQFKQYCLFLLYADSLKWKNETMLLLAYCFIKPYFCLLVVLWNHAWIIGCSSECHVCLPC